MRAIADLADIHYVRQGEPLGPRPRRVGRPQARRRRAVRRACSATTSWIDAVDACSTEMIDVHERYGRVGGGAQGVPAERDLVLRLRAPRGRSTSRSSASSASSRSRRPRTRRRTWRVMGRYVFTPEIFDALEHVQPGAGGEIQLTDAIGAAAPGADGLRATRSSDGPLRHRQEARLPAGHRRARRSTATTSGPSSAPSSPTSCSARSWSEAPRPPRSDPRLAVIAPATRSGGSSPSASRCTRRRSRWPTRSAASRRSTSRADEAVPPFANTAMDGFAVRAADTAGAPVRARRSSATLAAGAAAATARSAPGEAVRIMTGAPMPDGRRRRRDGRATPRVDDDGVGS